MCTTCTIHMRHKDHITLILSSLTGSRKHLSSAKRQSRMAKSETMEWPPTRASEWSQVRRSSTWAFRKSIGLPRKLEGPSITSGMCKPQSTSLCPRHSVSHGSNLKTRMELRGKRCSWQLAMTSSLIWFQAKLSSKECALTSLCLVMQLVVFTIWVPDICNSLDQSQPNVLSPLWLAWSTTTMWERILRSSRSLFSLVKNSSWPLLHLEGQNL